MSEQPARTQFDPGGHQVVEITVHRGYQPDSIRASAGVPLRIVFWREDDDACSERVVFSNPRLDHRLSATGATTIDLPAQPPGGIRFTCGMGRYRGHIEIVDDRRAPIVARLRSHATHLGPLLRTALVIWMCLLLPIALLASLGLDARAAITVAGAALVALLAGCLWAFRSSTHAT
jgi:Cupredoxin-like domain